jgi:hypothetical protein
MSSISSDDDYDASARSSSDGNRPLPPSEVAVEPKDDGFVDNYFIDDEHEHSLSEQIVHYVGGYVQPEHWLACKATLVFHAGAMTSKSVVTNKAAMEQYCLRTYIALVGSLDSNFFNDNARGFFLHSFKKKDQPIAIRYALPCIVGAATLCFRVRGYIRVIVVLDPKHLLIVIVVVILNVRKSNSILLKTHDDCQRVPPEKYFIQLEGKERHGKSRKVDC